MKALRNLVIGACIGFSAVMTGAGVARADAIDTQTKQWLCRTAGSQGATGLQMVVEGTMRNIVADTNLTRQQQGTLVDYYRRMYNEAPSSVCPRQRYVFEAVTRHHSSGLASDPNFAWATYFVSGSGLFK